MLVKLTSRNRVTLPADLVRRLPALRSFDATIEGGAIVLRPLQVVPMVDLERIRDEVAAAGASEDDASAAVVWARQPGR